MPARRQTDTETMFDAARVWALRHSGRRIRRIVIVLEDGEVIRLPVPLPFPVVPAEPAEAESCCRDNVLTVLREAAHRMTTGQMLAELERRDMVWGESTVKTTLAELVREGAATNDPDARPRGYAIA